MADLRFDETTKDLYLKNGELEIVRGVDETVQLIHQTLRMFRGEFFLDETLGIPYFQLMEKPINISLIKAILLAEISKIPNVLAINKFSLDIDTAKRTLKIDFSCKIGENNINFNEAITI